MSEIGCCFRVFCAHVLVVFLATSYCRCFESESVQLYLDCFFIFYSVIFATFWNFRPAFFVVFWDWIFGEISARTCEITCWSSIDSFLSGAPLILMSPNFPPFF